MLILKFLMSMKSPYLVITIKEILKNLDLGTTQFFSRQ